MVDGLDRRQVLKGTAAIGAVALLEGCDWIRNFNVNYNDVYATGEGLQTLYSRIIGVGGLNERYIHAKTKAEAFYNAKILKDEREFNRQAFTARLVASMKQHGSHTLDKEFTKISIFAS